MEERQREYETVYLLHPNLNDEQLENARERLSDAVEEADGHVLTFDDWGVRELAYEVRDESSGEKFENGRYQYLRYLAPSEEATVVEDELQFIEETLKYLTVKLDDDLIPEERLEEPSRQQEGETLPYEE
jgi:small subunit ribosomal protein S6